MSTPSAAEVIALARAKAVNGNGDPFATAMQDVVALATAIQRGERPREELAAVERMVRSLHPRAGSAHELPLLGWAELFKPLPPVPYLIPTFDVCPGAPTLVAGTWYAGKTLAIQSAAVTIVAGGSIWGSVTCARRGRVVHVDYEQGFRLTAERYQRLARARGIEPAELEGLRLAALPELHLSHDAATDAFCRAADNTAMLIVDSLSACGEDIDENSSEVRRLLDKLTKVSERTGTCPVVLHHTRKPSADEVGGVANAIRGSSSIPAACGSVLMFLGAKGEPTMVEHHKARTSGITAEPMALTFGDVEIDGNPRGGLEVRVVGCVPVEQRRADREKEKRAALDDQVFAFVAKNPGANLRGVRAEIPGKAQDMDLSLERLVRSGRLEEREGKRRSRTFWATSSGGGK